MDEDLRMVLVALFVGLIVGGIFGGLIAEQNYLKKQRELGHAICEEEYGMEYAAYYNGKLTCKPSSIKEIVKYDGIEVEIRELE